MTLSFLLTSLVACGETGGATGATGDDATSAAATTSGTGSTASASTDSTGDEPTGGSASETGTSTSTGATAGSTSAADTTGGTTTTTEMTAATTAETTGSATGETTGETTGGGTSPLVIAIVDAYLTADCMPEIEPDPVQGSWYVEFDNTNNPADTSAVLVSASLTPTEGDPPIQSKLTVTPLESGPIGAGEYVSIEMVKLPGAAIDACDHCGKFYKLELEYDEGGVTHWVEEDVTISCVF